LLKLIPHLQDEANVKQTWRI